MRAERVSSPFVLARPSVLVLVLALVACQRGATPGASCARQSDCASPLVCAYGRCRAECQQNRDCPAGASCLLVDGVGGACSLEVDTGCETGVGRACATGLVCAADRCEGGCATDAECPSDATCLRLATGAGFCFDTRTGADAGLGPPDGGRDAAGDAGHDAGSLQTDAGPALDAFVVPPIGVLDVCLGTTGGCAIGHDRHVYCWGSGADGRLGTGTCTTPGPDASVPMRIPGLADVDAIACGDRFQCAHVATDGSFLCWGLGDRQQLGQPAPGGCSTSPVNVLDPLTTPPRMPLTEHDLSSLSAAGGHACALAPRPVGGSGSNYVDCWGDNAGGIIDPMMPPTALFEAVQPTFWAVFPPTFASIALAPGGLCARNESSGVSPAQIDVVCTGDDAHMERGGVSVDTTPIPAATLSRALVAGRAHRCILDLHRDVRCWGDGHLGQLGVDPATLPSLCGADRCDSSLHTITASAVSFVSVAASGDGDTTCGVIAGQPLPDEVLCWGANDRAQAGRAPSALALPATTGGMAAPVTVDGTRPLSRVRRVAVGPGAACAIDDQETLYCWGDYLFGAASPTPSATVLSIPGGP